MKGESVTIASGSGATLKGGFIPGRSGAVVLMHGFAPQEYERRVLQFFAQHLK